jgi:hypothetical protein
MVRLFTAHGVCSRYPQGAVLGWLGTRPLVLDFPRGPLQPCWRRDLAHLSSLWAPVAAKSGACGSAALGRGRSAGRAQRVSRRCGRGLH